MLRAFFLSFFFLWNMSKMEFLLRTFKTKYLRTHTHKIFWLSFDILPGFMFGIFVPGTWKKNMAEEFVDMSDFEIYWLTIYTFHIQVSMKIEFLMIINNFHAIRDDLNLVPSNNFECNNHKVYSISMVYSKCLIVCQDCKDMHTTLL